MQTTPSQCQYSGKKIVLFAIFAICLAVGNAMAGWFIARGVYYARSGDRYVSVKGVAEK